MTPGKAIGLLIGLLWGGLREIPATADDVATETEGRARKAFLGRPKRAWSSRASTCRVPFRISSCPSWGGAAGSKAPDPVSWATRTDARSVGARRDSQGTVHEEKPLTVLWLFDETRSMLDDRRIVREKLDRIAMEIDRVPQADAYRRRFRHFGALRRSGNRDPTPRTSSPYGTDSVDDSGIENTFHAVHAVIEDARELLPAENRLLLVPMTDESGNDGDFVETALDSARKHKVPVYVIGRQAVFGSARVRLGEAGAWADDALLPSIRRGPESAIEVLAWDGLHERNDGNLRGSPYELGRLAKETWGIYFLLPSEEAQRVRQREKAYSLGTCANTFRTMQADVTTSPCGSVRPWPDAPRNHRGNAGLLLAAPLPVRAKTAGRAGQGSGREAEHKRSPHQGRIQAPIDPGRAGEAAFETLAGPLRFDARPGRRLPGHAPGVPSGRPSS